MFVCLFFLVYWFSSRNNNAAGETAGLGGGGCKYYATAKMHNKIEEAGLNFFLSLSCVFFIIIISFISYDFFFLGRSRSLLREKCIFCCRSVAF